MSFVEVASFLAMTRGLGCFVPRNDETVSCFVPRNDETVSYFVPHNEEMVSCFVPRNDAGVRLLRAL